MAIKALSLWQPWASLVRDEEKRIETRKWGTPYRGLLAIHATQSNCDKEFARQLGIYNPPLGAVLCIVSLADCHIMTAEFCEDIGRRFPDEYRYGNYQPGRWAWHLGMVKKFISPIPAKGNRQLWDWNEPIECR